MILGLLVLIDMRRINEHENDKDFLSLNGGDIVVTIWNFFSFLDAGKRHKRIASFARL